jgi:hypothetical protein
VTGHNISGKANVIIDDLVPNVTSGRPWHNAHVVWTTNELPVEFSSNNDDTGA